MWVKHTWNDIPANWESLGNPDAGEMIDLHMALIPEQERALTDALSEISDPMHPRYGAYLAKEQVAELVRPPPETVDLVRAWLVHHNIRPSSISLTHGGSWLTVTDVLVSQANQFLGASYQLYRNLKTNDMMIGTVGYALPAVLHARIQTVAPTTYFPFTQGMQQRPRGRPFAGEPAQAQGASGDVVTARQVPGQVPGITPSVLRWLYGTTEYEPKAIDQNKIGILGLDYEYPSRVDLTIFMTKYRPEGADAAFTVVQWNDGEYNQWNPADSANVGVQYATAIAYPTPVIFYSVGGVKQWGRDRRATGGDMYRAWLDKLLRESEIPQTISISYGHSEQDLPPEYERSLCRLFDLLAARGVTVLVASGMDGVGPENCTGADGIRFVTEFPSTCPFVTSVGGTVKANPEIAANLSGGGFSIHLGRENYQNAAMNRYLEAWDPDRHRYEGSFDRYGRGYPDISAQAEDFQYIIDRKMYFMDGTTCSVTTAAGVISLLNDFLISHDRPTLGALNPLLYLIMYRKGIEGINDVTSGANPGCGTPGFDAIPGWDPVSGLGTLNFEKMLLFLKDLYQIDDPPAEVPKPGAGGE